MIFEDRLQRVAFARVISDLIEADFIIEDTEMRFFEDINNRFHISRDMLTEAKKKTFAWALNTLKSLTEEQKSDVRNVLHDLALSDGTCVPYEALQIIAALSVLDGKGEVFSIPSAASYVENMKAVYIESEDDTEEDKYITDHYRAISNEMSLAGFDFVYIPQIAKDYGQMGEEYLRKSISYMIPSLTEERISYIQEELCSITTSRFCRDLLSGKMGIDVLGCKPALLFKIGESYVLGVDSLDDSEKKPYSNYLKVNIEGDILQQVVDFVDSYRKLVNCSSYVEIQPVTKKFLYYGFHRSLFDLIAFCKDRTEYKMLINLENHKEPVISFISDGSGYEAEELKMTPMATSLYLLMIQQSVFGQGLDWREMPGKEGKDSLLEKFNSIYSIVGNRSDCKDYKDRVLVSRIKKELRKLGSIVSNIDVFIPELKNINSNSFYNVPVPSDSVLVMERGIHVRIADSKFWISL